MKDENKLVSIVVPVYGVENYISECVDSLLDQDYKNIEIILVDDESPDQCPVICNIYAQKDNRVRVIHQKNGGAGKARNTGLANVRGDYICFVDSDDYVSRNYVSTLVETLETNEADIAVADYYSIYKNEMVAGVHPVERKVYTDKEYLLHFLQNWSCSLIWNKIFKREVLQGIQFVEGRKIDDEFFTYQAVMNASKIASIDKYIYFYRMRISSVMNSSPIYQEKILMDRVDYIFERYQKVIKKYPELKKYYLENLMDNIIILRRNSISYLKVRKNINENIGKKLGNLIFGPALLKEKIVFWYNYFFEKKQEDNQLIEKNKKDNLFQ